MPTARACRPMLAVLSVLILLLAMAVLQPPSAAMPLRSQGSAPTTPDAPGLAAAQGTPTPPNGQGAAGAMPIHGGDVMPAPPFVRRPGDSALTDRPYRLAVYYALPAGIPFEQEVLDQLRDASRDIQAWYQVASGGLTWEWALPDIVEVYRGQNTREYYAENGGWWGSLLPEMGNAGLPLWQPGVVTAIWAQGAGWWAGGAQGCEGDCGVVLLGVELFPQFNNSQWTGKDCPDPAGRGRDAWPCTPEGAYAHELGHTLGLPHPADDPLTNPYAGHSIMQTHWNYPDEARGDEAPWGFLRSERQRIRGNPFLKADVVLRQRYQDLDIVVNLPPAGTGPAAAFDSIVDDNVATFRNASQGADLHYWAFGDLGVSNVTSPEHMYPGIGTYTARLWVSDHAGTLSTTSRPIVVTRVRPSTATPTATTTSTPTPTPTSSPTATPTLQHGPGRILYSSAPSWDLPHDIYVMDDDGSNVRRLTNGPGWNVDGRFSPDGSRIVFLSDRSGSAYVYSMNADGSDVRQLARGGWSGIEGAPDWSPGGLIAYMCPEGLCVMNADGSNARLLSTRCVSYPRWSNDGTKIACRGDQGIVVMNADGSNPVNLTSFPSTVNWMPSWSPDDKRLAYTHWTTPYEEYIYVIDADGSNRHAITGSEYNSHAVWSPDGARIAFHSSRGGMLKNVYVMNADGAMPYRLTYRDDWPSDWWSPDPRPIGDLRTYLPLMIRPR